MPSKPPRACGRCGAIVPYGGRCTCSNATRKAEAAAYDHQRGHSADRGYDRAWRKLREAYIAANPLCEHCLRDEVVEVAVDVDHVEPISVAPERRLDATNLQSLCRSHHNAKTRAETRGWV